MATGNVREIGPNKFLLTLDFGYHPDTKKRKRSSSTFSGTEREANKELDRLLDEASGWGDINPYKTSISKFIKIYLGAIEAKGLAKSTLRRYKQILELRIEPALGHLFLGKITGQNIQDFFDGLPTAARLDKSKGNKPLSQESIDYHYRVLHGVFAAAQKKKLIKHNPCDSVDKPRTLKPFDDDTDSDVAFFTPLQVKKLILSLKDVRRVLISTAVKTGLRRGELLALQWSDIDFDAGTLSVKRSLQYTKADGYSYKPPKTKKSRRTIDISTELTEELKKWKAHQDRIRLRLGTLWQKNNLVFDNGDGGWMNPDSVSAWFPDHAEKQGLPRHNFHILRHTHASILLAHKADIKEISERLGHATIRITYDLYSHLMPGHGKTLASRMESALS